METLDYISLALGYNWQIRLAFRHSETNIIEHICIKYLIKYARRLLGVTFIRKIGSTKGYEKDNQNRVRSHVPDRRVR